MKHSSLFIKHNILQFILLQFGNKNTSHLHLFNAKDIFSFTIQMKATKQYFPVVLIIIMLYKVVLTFESVDEILKCDYPNESY